VLKRLKNLFKGKKPPAKPPGVQVNRQSTLRSDYDRMMEAITFAEAGLTSYAQELLQRDRAEPRKILVVEKGEGLSPRVMEYALELAGRLGSALVILQVVSVPGGLKEPLPLYKQHLLQSQAERSRRAVQEYRRQAEAKGITIQHLVKFGDLKEALTDVHRDIRRIELVIAGREVQPEKLEARLTVPVFHIT